jgi:CRP/FNR family transcriptional regulator, cyclic AMP receptor protein
MWPHAASLDRSRGVLHAVPRVPAITSRVALLERDPDLAAHLSGVDLQAAVRHLTAPELRIPAGRWDPSALRHLADRSLGLLVLDGIVARTTSIDGRDTSHLYGDGDVVRPWQELDPAPTDRPNMCWTALTPVRAALLDQGLVAGAARWPSVLVELSRRTARQTERIELHVAMGRMPRLEDRLILLFWELGQRWGRATVRGIVVPLNLTHEVIAALVAASRPPVSAALTRLAREGTLVREAEGGWVLDPNVEPLLH